MWQNSHDALVNKTKMQNRHDWRDIHKTLHQSAAMRISIVFILLQSLIANIYYVKNQKVLFIHGANMNSYYKN